MAINDFLYLETAPIKNGDFILDLSEQAHIEDIVFANKGEYRQWPLLGTGGLNFLNSNLSLDEIRERVSKQLNYDNFIVKDIAELIDGSIRITAEQNETL